MHAVRVVLCDLLLALELDQAAERVPAELAEQGALGPAKLGRVGAGAAGPRLHQPGRLGVGLDLPAAAQPLRQLGHHRPAARGKSSLPQR